MEFIGDDVSEKVAPLENLIQQQNGEISQTAEMTEDLEFETVKSKTTEKDSTTTNFGGGYHIQYFEDKNLPTKSFF